MLEFAKSMEEPAVEEILMACIATSPNYEDKKYWALKLSQHRRKKCLDYRV